jgi:late competence protein required for DNA uptake (superfamily II DNA/RNA helicase)
VEQVTVMASRWRWVCPGCDKTNQATNITTGTVACYYCRQAYQIQEVQHGTAG